jgi:hypothetical protein
LRSLWASLPEGDLSPIPEPEGSLQWEWGSYRLSGVLVLRPTVTEKNQAGRMTFEVVIASDPSTQMGMMNGTYLVSGRPPTDAADGSRGKGARSDARPVDFNPLGQLARPGLTEIVVPWEPWSRTATTFEARPGQVNEWTIPLPDEVLDAIRQRLKAGANTKAE